MTTITVSSYHSASLASARRAGESRKHIWSAIRQQFGIPTSLKLGKDSNNALYVKDSSPRKFLQADDSGRYSDVLTNRSQAASQVSFPVDAPVQPVDARFAVSDINTHLGPWLQVNKADLLDLLRDCADADDAALPVGFPADLGQDAVVFDPTTGTIYFRDAA